MTGRDLIIYILQNNLEDEPVFKDDKILGFMTETEAAAKLGVGKASIRAAINMGMLEGIRIGDSIYIPVIEVEGGLNASKNI